MGHLTFLPGAIGFFVFSVAPQFVQTTLVALGILLAPGQLPMRGKAAFASAQVALKRFRIECSHAIQEIRVIGDWAYCWNELSVMMTPQNGGAPVIRAGNALSILNKQDDGRWLVVRDANMLALVQN